MVVAPEDVHHSGGALAESSTTGVSAQRAAWLAVAKGRTVDTSPFCCGLAEGMAQGDEPRTGWTTVINEEREGV
jgi:hypothetical protein